MLSEDSVLIGQKSLLLFYVSCSSSAWSLVCEQFKQDTEMGLRIERVMAIIWINNK